MVGDKQNVRVLLADDHQVFRQALRVLMQNQPGIEVVGEAADGRSAVAMSAELQPDIVLMDIEMADLNGIEATRQIVVSSPQTKVVALTAHFSKQVTAKMLHAGASGFVPKLSAFEEVTEAIETAMAGKIYISPKVANLLMESEAGDRDAATARERLSPREREVLQLISEGKATKEVAAALNLSVKTVETHRKNVMDKLSIDSIAMLTKYAIREGITSLDG